MKRIKDIDWLQKYEMKVGRCADELLFEGDSNNSHIVNLAAYDWIIKQISKLAILKQKSTMEMRCCGNCDHAMDTTLFCTKTGKEYWYRHFCEKWKADNQTITQRKRKWVAL